MRPARPSDVFDAVAHPVRRRILATLRDGERPAGELARPFRMSAAGVSQHLKILREAALVAERREGRRIVYRINPQPLRELHRWAAEFESFWSERLDALERHLARRKAIKAAAPDPTTRSARDKPSDRGS